MEELHAMGKSIDDIADVLKRAPLDPHVSAGIKSAYALGYHVYPRSNFATNCNGLMGYYS